MTPSTPFAHPERDPEPVRVCGVKGCNQTPAKGRLVCPKRLPREEKRDEPRK